MSLKRSLYKKGSDTPVPNRTSIADEPSVRFIGGIAFVDDPDVVYQLFPPQKDNKEATPRLDERPDVPSRRKGVVVARLFHSFCGHEETASIRMEDEVDQIVRDGHELNVWQAVVSRIVTGASVFTGRLRSAH